MCWWLWNAAGVLLLRLRLQFLRLNSATMHRLLAVASLVSHFGLMMNTHTVVHHPNVSVSPTVDDHAHTHTYTPSTHHMRNVSSCVRVCLSCRQSPPPIIPVRRTVMMNCDAFTSIPSRRLLVWCWPHHPSVWVCVCVSTCVDSPVCLRVRAQNAVAHLLECHKEAYDRTERRAARRWSGASTLVRAFVLSCSAVLLVRFRAVLVVRIVAFCQRAVAVVVVVVVVVVRTLSVLGELGAYSLFLFFPFFTQRDTRHAV